MQARSQILILAAITLIWMLVSHRSAAILELYRDEDITQRLIAFGNALSGQGADDMDADTDVDPGDDNADAEPETVEVSAEMWELYRNLRQHNVRALDTLLEFSKDPERSHDFAALESALFSVAKT